MSPCTYPLSKIAVIWHDLTWPRKSPNFNLHHLWKISTGFKMAVLTPKLGIGLCVNIVFLASFIKLNRGWFTYDLMFFLIDAWIQLIIVWHLFSVEILWNLYFRTLFNWFIVQWWHRCISVFQSSNKSQNILNFQAHAHVHLWNH